ncbi:MAG: hypothetical protein A3I17_09625 [Candidatus Rokubacteria bacterium RIFCSPLOWO2_02_FULL_72_37]|nr:MAG: hypothetical protein A3I17_09625 [Candidatus Rokubacteria bacterium RIFCSPLOWO2_02_FULL_72_37]
MDPAGAGIEGQQLVEEVGAAHGPRRYHRVASHSKACHGATADVKNWNGGLEQAAGAGSERHRGPVRQQHVDGPAARYPHAERGRVADKACTERAHGLQ